MGGPEDSTRYYVITFVRILLQGAARLPDLYRPRTQPALAVTEISSPSSAPLKWLSLSTILLEQSEPEYMFSTGDEEAVLDIFGGLCTVNIRGPQSSVTYPEIGGRLNVFGGKPTMVYIPRQSKVSIFAESPVFDGVIISAPAANSHDPAVIYPEEAETRTVGKDN